MFSMRLLRAASPTASIAEGMIEQSGRILSRLLGPASVVVADIGAAGGLADRWEGIAESVVCVAFEPDLRSNPGPGGSGSGLTVRKAAAGRSEQRTFYLTEKRTSSSLLRPSMSVRNRLRSQARLEIVEEIDVECVTIDDAFADLGLRTPDFIKVDTQGTELEILQGAAGALPGCLGLEVEAQFRPLYEGAGLFRDVDAYVTGFGFELYDLRRHYHRRGTDPPVAQKRGQIAYGDALYFRDWQDVAGDREALRRLAALLLVYGYADVVTELLSGDTNLSLPDRAELAEACSKLVTERVVLRRDDRTIGSGFGLRLPRSSGRASGSTSTLAG
jgi:FkbM family methyltransferase